MITQRYFFGGGGGRLQEGFRDIQNWLAFTTSNNQTLGSAFDDLHPRLFAKLVLMSSTPAKSAGDARYASPRSIH